MGTISAANIAVEIVWLRGKSGSKKDLVHSFKKIFDLSTEVAIEGGTEPALGLKPYNTVFEHPNSACMFLYWNSLEQHDNLAAKPKFEAGSAKIMTETVLPKLEEPIESFYVHSTSSELVLSDADCVEIIEVQSTIAEPDDGFVKSVDESLRKTSVPTGFLGSYSGPKSDDPDIFVVVTKWSSNQVLKDNSWSKESEESLLGLFPKGARIANRWQMHV
ncbi:hypothetical protein LTR10_019470 [Elasticomyces elasticus]|uniref:ABM domain-containing protein n=1 Tax=Exophiala sideris TaxID=1016849 RepID=A0ABR0JLB0_9EURO|nr:hypothetical protein LTR10_019470 [Elasticomyces elasticus]KAK5035527.1 hypothetical protein LTS07_002966 [Exophiala sideris]KAK5039123.1 hypothetical protein LTR13_003378 [Exophiala sideris]KAK5066452.1 hypothetical protein LTR69_002972 [Exophiala sideris]KAK5187129.1 hypothetical protein LTR44_001137 [Eurotiomycetes sp. CCFEE 6388]